METTTCLPRETLKRYLSGAIAVDSTELIEEHISICSACEQTILQLESDPDTLLESMRELSGVESQANSAPSDSPSVVQRAIAAARVLTEPPMVPATPLQKLGKIGAYELLRSLGCGGMGQVFLARHTSLDKQVAVKLLFPRHGYSSLDTELLVSRFQREMRAAGRLNHPTIVSATDAGQEGGMHYLVMEYIDGIDLSRLAKATGPLPIADTCELIRQVAQGLSHAHAEGIVHRDIKPSNIMLDRQGRVKILDFGLAQWNLLTESANELTTVGQLMGTLDYMAPEQAERNDGVDYRADLYALGATLFRLLTGRPPLAASPGMTLLEKVRLLGSQNAPSLSSLRSDAPRALVQLVSSLLHRQLMERPASAAHVAEALEPFCAGSDLISLIAQADAIIAQDSVDVAVASEPPSDSQAKVAAAQLPPSSTFGSKWILAAAALPLMILSGIVITLELQKGQLVIQSDVANVQVKLRRDNQTIRELTIQPGATTTRLSADEYEIVIDSPSDQVSLDKEGFVIRNGQTIVANIKSNPPVTNLGSTNPRPPKPVGASPGSPSSPVPSKPQGASPGSPSSPVPSKPQGASPGSPNALTANDVSDPITGASALRHSQETGASALRLSEIPNALEYVLNGEKSVEDRIKELDSESIEDRLYALLKLKGMPPNVDLKAAIPKLINLITTAVGNANDNYVLWELGKNSEAQLALQLLVERCSAKSDQQGWGIPFAQESFLASQLDSTNNLWRRVVLVRATQLAESKALGMTNQNRSFRNGKELPKAILYEQTVLKAIEIVNNPNEKDILLVEAAADYLLPFAGQPLAKQESLQLAKTNYNNPNNPMNRDPMVYLEPCSRLSNDYWMRHSIKRQAPIVQTLIIKKARETLANFQASPESVLLALSAFEYSEQPGLENAIASRIEMLLKDRSRLTKVYRIISRMNGTYTVEPFKDWKLNPDKLDLPHANEYSFLVKHALVQNLRGSSMLSVKQALEQAGTTLKELAGSESERFKVVTTGTVPGTHLPSIRLTQRDDNAQPLTSLSADQQLLSALSAFTNWANSDEVQMSIAKSIANAIFNSISEVSAKVAANKASSEATDGQSSAESSKGKASVLDWLTMLEKTTEVFDRDKCLNSLVEVLDETHADTATPRLLAAARSWDYKNPASLSILDELRTNRLESQQRSNETLLIMCLAECNSADRFLTILCDELLIGEDKWTARWLAGLARYNPPGSFPGKYNSEILMRLLTAEFASGQLSKFGPDSAVLWQEVVRRELRANRRFAQLYSKVAVKRILAQPHLGSMALMRMNLSPDNSPTRAAENGQLVFEEAVASQAKIYLADQSSSPELLARAAFRLASTGPFVERWREELIPAIRSKLQDLIKQEDALLFGRLNEPLDAQVEWMTNVIPGSTDVFKRAESNPSNLRYVNSLALSYLALIKRLELTRELDKELTELLNRAIAARQPLRQMAKQKHEWIPQLSWSGNRGLLVPPWNEAPAIAWDANHIYNAIVYLTHDSIQTDLTTKQIVIHDETRARMEQADKDDDGRLSAKEIEQYAGRALPEDTNQDGSWDFDELLAHAVKGLERWKVE